MLISHHHGVPDHHGDPRMARLCSHIELSLRWRPVEGRGCAAVLMCVHHTEGKGCISTLVSPPLFGSVEKKRVMYLF